MNVPVLLAADIESIVKVLTVILLILVPAIGQLVARMRAAGQPGAPRPVRPPRPEGGTVQQQIDEFLRRASQRQRGGAKPAEPAGPVTAEVVEDQAVGGRVGKQVKQYLDTSEFGRRSSQMGGEVAEADQQFDQRLEQKFSGEVGHLASRPGEAATEPQARMTDDAEEMSPDVTFAATAAGGLSDFLGNPESLLQAIIVSEILRRREEE